MTALADFTHDPGSERVSLQGLGTLWLVLDDGRTVVVGLYHTRGGACVYSVGNKCYSGGSDKEVDDALRDSYITSIFMSVIDNGK